MNFSKAYELPFQNTSPDDRGIDLTPVQPDLQIKRDQNGVPLPLPLQNISNIHLEGLSPIILDDQPVTFQISPFLLTQELQLKQLQFLPGGPIEKNLSEIFFCTSGLNPNFSFTTS